VYLELLDDTHIYGGREESEGEVREDRFCRVSVYTGIHIEPWRKVFGRSSAQSFILLFFNLPSLWTFVDLLRMIDLKLVPISELTYRHSPKL
jgi:hypothetical protein